jgi:hypothetical protein
MARKNNSERTTLFIKFGSLYPRIVKIAEQFHLSASGVVRMVVSITLPGYEATPSGDSGCCGSAVSRVLAIDSATTCGWADSSGESGTWNLTPKRDESLSMRPIRFRHKQIGHVLAGSATCNARGHSDPGLCRVRAKPQCGLRLTFSSQRT